MHLLNYDLCCMLQVRKLEFIIDSLIDEKDRSTQKRGDNTNSRVGGATSALHGSSSSTGDGSSQLSLEINVSRPAEIEAALQQFVTPKVCCPKCSVEIRDDRGCYRGCEIFLSQTLLQGQDNGVYFMNMLHEAKTGRYIA